MRYGRFAAGATALGLILAMQAGTAQADVTRIIDDCVSTVSGGVGEICMAGTPAQAVASTYVRRANAGPPNWVDEIGVIPPNGGQFQSTKVEVIYKDQAPGGLYRDIEIRLYTNFPLGGVSQFGNLGMADVFFDINKDFVLNKGDFVFDIASTGGGSNPQNITSTTGTLYEFTDGSPITMQTSAQWASSSGQSLNIYGAKYNVLCNESTIDCDTNPKDPLTKYISGGVADTNNTNIAVTSNDAGVPPPDIFVSFLLNDVNLAKTFEDFGLAWMTAWCANDAVWGDVKGPGGDVDVPIPAALPMLLAAVAGLGLAGRRARRVA